MVPPFNPQKVQWDRIPHQQPREVSHSKIGAAAVAAPVRSNAKK
jgi:hypothetical protein